MRELTFPDSTIPLCIAGKKFTVRPDRRFSETVRQLSRESERLAELAADGSSIEAEAFLCRAVDSLLGEGAVAVMFGEEEPDLFDLCDVIGYLCDRLSEYRDARLRRLMGRREAT